MTWVERYAITAPTRAESVYVEAEGILRRRLEIGGLSEDVSDLVRKLMTDSWREMSDEARERARNRPEAWLKTLNENGILK